MLKPERDEGFLRLAPESPLAAKIKVLGQLLGDGRAPLHDRPGPEVGNNRAANAKKIKAKMVIKPLVLCRKNSLNQIWRHLVKRDNGGVAPPPVGDFVTLPVKHGNGKRIRP